MNCVEAKEHLENYLDGETGGILRDEIESHLDSCGSCRAAFAELRAVSRRLQNDLPAVPSKQLDAKVLAAFRQHHREKKTASNGASIWAAFFIRKPVFALLTICFLTGSAFLLGRMTAPLKEVTVAGPPQIIEKEVPNQVVEEIVENREVPAPRIVEIPIQKERIVTRTVYRKIETKRKELARTANAFNPANSFEQVDLRDFRPLGEITPKVLRNGETNEK